MGFTSIMLQCRWISYKNPSHNPRSSTFIRNISKLFRDNTHYCHGYCQVPRFFLSNSLAQLEMAWYMNPKGRTGQLFPTQLNFYLLTGWCIRLKTLKTQKVQVIKKIQIHFKQFQYQVPRLTTVGIAATIPTNDRVTV